MQYLNMEGILIRMTNADYKAYLLAIAEGRYDDAFNLYHRQKCLGEVKNITCLSAEEARDRLEDFGIKCAKVEVDDDEC